MREEGKDDSHKQANPRTEKHVQSRTSSRNKNMKSIKKKEKENQDPSPGVANPRQKLRQTQKKEMAPREKTLGKNTRSKTETLPSRNPKKDKLSHHRQKFPSPRQRKEHNTRRKIEKKERKKSTCESRSEAKKLRAKEVPEMLPPEAREGNSQNGRWKKKTALENNLRSED
jgi:hypothetical protein